MSGFYVLDVPEFAPIVAAARDIPGCEVQASRKGYVLVRFSGNFEIKRAATGLSEAVWFGCLTGGLDGKIQSFDAESIRLTGTNEPISADLPPSDR